jgi:hypothetical protein
MLIKILYKASIHIINSVGIAFAPYSIYNPNCTNRDHTWTTSGTVPVKHFVKNFSPGLVCTMYYIILKNKMFRHCLLIDGSCIVPVTSVQCVYFIPRFLLASQSVCVCFLKWQYRNQQPSDQPVSFSDGKQWRCSATWFWLEFAARHESELR